MRKILVTNDDGIDSNGILRLAKVAMNFGEVTVVAPNTGRSGCSQSITLNTHIDIHPVEIIKGVSAYACSGTPADCVRVAKHNIMKDGIDIVFSGINNGYNVGLDIQYSATAGAAFEASFQGVKGIAVSEGAFGLTETADKYLGEILSNVIDKDILPNQIININFPDCKLEECNGILYDRKVYQGSYYFDEYREIDRLKGGGKRLVVEGKLNSNVTNGTDLRAVIDGYVSVGVATNIT